MVPPRELTQQLNDLLSQDRDDKPPDRVQDTGDGMQIWEKLDLWHSAIRADSPPEGGSDELFEGVGDEDGELTMPLSTYSQIVLNSPAYGWFISRLKTECSQPSIARRHIASLILSRFPTARISKHRLPDKHRASFLLSWQSIADQARLRCARVKSSLEPGAILPSMATLTSSSDNEMQATIAGDYLHETWPCLGRKLLYVVSLTVNGGPGTSTSGKIP